MATPTTTQQNPPDATLPQILAALQSIADAVNRSVEVLGNPPQETVPSQEQSTAIVDYLVLRELVGRQFDEVRRTVAATRSTGQIVIFDGPIPANAVKVAVFTRRSAQPDEESTILIDDGEVTAKATARKTGSGRGGSGQDPLVSIVLSVVTDDQPIVRLELRDANGLAVALGPRSAPVN